VQNTGAHAGHDRRDFVFGPKVPVSHVNRSDFMLRLDSFDVRLIDQGIQDVPDPMPVIPEIILNPQFLETLGDDLSTFHLGHLLSPFFFSTPLILM
jgi:hypothetical protein